jgi:hypothetical protein
VKKFKIFNLFRSIAPDKQKDNSQHILKWGKNNDFPQQLIKTIYESHTASASLDTYIDFLEGDGISQPDLAKFKINKKQTLDELHSVLCPDEGYMEGVAIAIKYNALGEKIELTHLPFENVRLGIPDDQGYISKIHYNPLYGDSDFKDTDTICYDVYNPDPQVILSQAEAQGPKYYGQVFYFSHEKPMKRFYPEPFFYGGLKWFVIDNKIGIFHERNIDNNFLLSVLFKMVGDPDEALETDENGKVRKTVGQAFDEFLSNEFSGAEKGGLVMALWAKVKDDFPEITPFPSNTNHELFTTLQRLTIDNISIATKVPPRLANIQVSSGFSTDEIVNSIKLMYQRVNKKQRTLERIYKELLTNFKDAPDVSELTIRNINPVEVVPPEVWSALTREEQRQFVEANYDIELIPVQSDIDANKELLIERIGVGGATTLVSLLQSLGQKQITREQFISTMEILFGLNKEEAEKIAGQLEVTPKPVQPDAV